MDKRTRLFRVKANPNLSKGLNILFQKFGGQTVESGLYRVHKFEDTVKWNDIIGELFPQFMGEIQCFGYDWLVRQFATDKDCTHKEGERVLMFEPGTEQVLEIPCNVIAFHDIEIIKNPDLCLARSFYAKWASERDIIFIENKKCGEYLMPSLLECVGYRIPLFLGGKDDITNLELVDMETYWTICSKLVKKQNG